METQRDKELGLAAAYAQKYWDAGNLLITLMFGVAFGIFYLLAQSGDARKLVAEYWEVILTVSVIGNLALAIVIWRFGVNERILVQLITADEKPLEAIWSAVELRWGLLAANFLLYALVIGLVARYT